MAKTPDVLLVGAGDLGTEIGFRLDAAGETVVALRRRVDLVPAPLVGVSGDIANGLPQLPMFGAEGPRLLVVCLSAGGRNEDAYREVFLRGVRRVLDDVRARGWAPERALLVSSTGVCAPAGAITEETPPDPASPTAQILLDAERRFLAGLPRDTTGIVVRPSGLYGPGREWFIEQVRNGSIRDPERMTHRIHRDDAAGAITHLLTMPSKPLDLYLLTDDAPASADEVAAFIAKKLGIPWQRTESTSRSGERHLCNTRLRATGFRFTYPSFREGYSAILDGVGTRHP